jgi:hypothetical protein
VITLGQLILSLLGFGLTIIAAQVGASFTLHRENKRKNAEWMKKVDDNHKLLQTLIGEYPLHTHTEKRGALSYDGIKPMKVQV